MNRAFDAVMALIAVAGITTIVSHKETAKDIKSGGDAFIGSLRAAQGN